MTVARALLLLPAILSGCAVGALVTRRASFPEHSGDRVVVGLSAPLTVTRDEWNVPHIRAGSVDDACFGLGYVHAQDRLFQADLYRRLALGGLAEWVGEDAVEVDAFVRGMELRARSRAIYDRLSPELRGRVDAYTAGFNAGATDLPALPLEFRVLGVEFAPWQPEDTMGSLWLNAWGLAENPREELAALALRTEVDADLLDALYRVDPTEPAVSPEWDRVRALPLAPWTPTFASFARFFGGTQVAAASNNWIVGGERTASRAPIVANDPHLLQGTPALWYPADLGAPGFHVAGMTLAGSPAVVLGHNEHIAWGFTNVMADVVDLALVPTGGRGADGYRLGGELRPLRTVTVDVPVKGGHVERRTVQMTDIGPLLTTTDGSRATEGTATGGMGEGTATGGAWGVVLQWAALAVEDHSFELFAALNTATDVDDALRAVDRPTMIAQNLVVADGTGDYAWQAFGSYPNRVGFDGRTPYDASSIDRRWDGWLPPIPGERRPARGWVRSANARPETMPDAWRVGTRYVNGARQERIDAVIGARTDHTLATMAALQVDQLDLHAQELLPKLLDGVTVTTPDGQACLDRLRAWDHVAAPDSIGAAVWYPFQAELVQIALADDLTPAGLHAYLGTALPGWSVLDGRLERVLPDRAAGVAAALDATCHHHRERFGSTPPTWGVLHVLRLDHPFASASALLSGWSVDPIPWGGSDNTVNAAGLGFRAWAEGDAEMTVEQIPSMRFLAPMEDLAHAQFVLPGGVSGHVGNPHRDDLLPLWQDGRLTTLWFTDADVAAHATGVLTLRGE